MFSVVSLKLLEKVEKELTRAPLLRFPLDYLISVMTQRWESLLIT